MRATALPTRAGAALLALALALPLAGQAAAQTRTSPGERPEDFELQLRTQISGLFGLYRRQLDQAEANAMALPVVADAQAALDGCRDGACAAGVYRDLARELTALGALESNTRFKYAQFDATARGLEGKRTSRRAAVADFADMVTEARRSTRGRSEAVLLDRLEAFNTRAAARSVG